jgi:hypothetical protein
MFEIKPALQGAMQDYIRQAFLKALHGGKLATRQKADTSTVTDTDIANTTLAEAMLVDFGMSVIIEENDPMGFAELGEHLQVDPLDGTGAYAAGSLQWAIHAAWWKNDAPGFSVIQTDGLRPVAVRGGEWLGFPSHSPGLWMVVTKDRVHYAPTPLKASAVGWLPEFAQPVTPYHRVVISPDILLPTSYFYNGLRVVTSESSIVAQAQVLLGQADAAIFGSSQPLPYGAARPVEHQKLGAKSWDVLTLPRADGYRWVHLNPADWQNSVVIESLAPLVDEHFHLTAQIMLAHESLIETLLPRLAAQRAMLR